MKRLSKLKNRNTTAANSRLYVGGNMGEDKAQHEITLATTHHQIIVAAYSLAVSGYSHEILFESPFSELSFAEPL